MTVKPVDRETLFRMFDGEDCVGILAINMLY